MLSLKDILQKQDKVYHDEDNNFECYLMNDNGMAIREDSENAKTIIVKRIQLQFDETESTVINFTDITAYIRLKHEEEVNNLLKTLNASVHHEMVVPLKVNIEMADRLK